MVDVAKILFYESANRELTWFFPQRMNNSVMLWAAFNGSIGLVIFFLYLITFLEGIMVLIPIHGVFKLIKLNYLRQ